MLGTTAKAWPMRKGSSDRRTSDRFPIVRDVRYKILNSRGEKELGTGKTINISSTGVLFAADEALTPGRRLEISISWPAQLDGKCGLKLVARGRVVRCHGKSVAVEIEKYEFRTAASKSLRRLEAT